MLGHITSLTKNITVVGSHGKTTTTSLISAIFSKTKLDPTIINGGVINSLDNSARLGKSKWSILELDESEISKYVSIKEKDDSFSPDIKTLGLFIVFLELSPTETYTTLITASESFFSTFILITSLKQA